MTPFSFPFTSRAEVFNRGRAPLLFLNELVAFGKSADPDIFAPNDRPDIYNKVKPELGPFTSQLHRTAVMLEVLRVLAGFESSWDWTEGVDTSRLGPDTPDNAEAGAWQISYDAKNLGRGLSALCADYQIFSGIKFQQEMKFNHLFAMEFTASLLRHNTKHNGPLYKDAERLAIRKSLRGPLHSIYPWLRREAVKEFQVALEA